ncbi:MAG: pilus assembly protein [Alphaproteobacteria bacterium]|nr:pilus assembly protein [Alphaproteobacteria bacterium]
MKKSFFKSDKGAAAIEAAFIMPFLFLLYFSLQDLTALITFNRRVTATAATVGDTVSQYSTTVPKSTVDDIFNSVAMIMSPTPSTDVHVDVYGYYMNGATVTKKWKASNGGSPTCTAPDTTNYANLMSAGNDLVVSVACMNYSPFIAQFMGTNVLGKTSFLLNQTITSRPRASLSLNCVTVAGGSTSCNY